MKPLGDRVFVKQTDNPKKVGSIIMPETLKRPLKGKIIASGDDSTLSIGQTILFQYQRGQEVDYPDNSGSFLVLEEKHILGYYE